MKLKEVITGTTNALRNIDRYSREPLIQIENVAEHSYYVIFYSWMISNDLISKGHKIDIQKVMESAMLHDMEESVFGDLPRPIKKAYPELDSMIIDAAYSAVKNIFDKTGFYDAEYPAKIWKNAMNGSLAGKIVKFSDDLDVFAYAYEEARKGNTRMADLFIEHLNYIKDFRSDPLFADYIGQIDAMADSLKNPEKQSRNAGQQKKEVFDSNWKWWEYDGAWHKQNQAIMQKRRKCD